MAINKINTRSIQDTTVTSDDIQDNAITNAKVSPSAAIAQSKVSGLTTSISNLCSSISTTNTNVTTLDNKIIKAKKIDAIREKIDSFFPNDCIEKSVLITSLILSMDKVSNDMGHQVSYLKTWTKKSYGDIILEVPNFKIDNLDHKVYQKTIFDVESLRYASRIWTTVLEISVLMAQFPSKEIAELA